jgi:hypothetical protein
MAQSVELAYAFGVLHGAGEVWHSVGDHRGAPERARGSADERRGCSFDRGDHSR